MQWESNIAEIEMEQLKIKARAAVLKSPILDAGRPLHIEISFQGHARLDGTRAHTLPG